MAIEFFIDLETIPDQRDGAFERYIDEVKPPASYKKQESIDNWLFENAERVALENWQKTALDGLHGEICSISWAVNDNDIQHLTRFHDVSEAELLDTFWQDVYHLVRELGGDKGKWPQLEWIAHNAEFDLRMLKQRCMINRVTPLFSIPTDARHGTGSVFCTMKEWAGWRGYVKLDELVEAFGIETPIWAAGLEDLDGSDVLELWTSKQFDKLSLYNQLDVFKVREVFKRMMFR